ncbi:hypothetical protein [Actinoplanes palleronii]|uniref:hypothetical protein n=1 Tax=Actinoplanes palleronii TaxID=113570 RepID=UPI001940CED9|nr:hypothetical protein [Actinoplanes palleronii]
MPQSSARDVPARADGWRPQDPVLNNLIHKCIEDAQRRNSETGSMTAFFGGGIVLMILGVILAVGTGSPLLAMIVVVVLAGGGLFYAGVSTPSPPADPMRVLDVLGGPGNLPAGYLVYAPAWKAGLTELLARVTDRELSVAVRLCREHPGSIADLIRLVLAAEQHAHEHAFGHTVTETDVFRVAQRATTEWARVSPTTMLSA